jgi:hypothetical protein
MGAEGGERALKIAKTRVNPATAREVLKPDYA